MWVNPYISRLSGLSADNLSVDKSNHENSLLIGVYLGRTIYWISFMLFNYFSIALLLLHAATIYDDSEKIKEDKICTL